MRHWLWMESKCWMLSLFKERMATEKNERKLTSWIFTSLCLYHSRTIQCQSQQNITNDILKINFVIQYPKACVTAKCQQRTTDTTILHMQRSFSSIVFTIKMSNGVIVPVSSNFCSLNQFSSTITTTSAYWYSYLVVATLSLVDSIILVSLSDFDRN